MEQNKAAKRKRIIVQSTAGIAASFTQHLLHPFDLIKVRFQSHDSGKREANLVPKYKSLWDSLKTIKQQEGFRGFYKGMLLSMLASNISYGIFFALYERMKQAFEKNISNEVYLNIAASASAASISSFVMQPLFVLKTRRLLDQQSDLGLKRIVSLFREVRSQHGVGGFYRGYTLSLMLGLYGVSQLTTYKYLTSLTEMTYGQAKTPNWVIMVIGAVSRLLTSVVLHPLTTVRTRFQQNQFVEASATALQQQKYESIPDIVRKTWRGEGARGFFKGIVPLTFRTVPSHGLFFLAYENTKNFMSRELGIDHIK